MKDKYISGKYKITFKDKRIEYMNLSKQEIKFIHKHMYQLNIGEWEIKEEVPCDVTYHGGDMEFFFAN